MFDLEKAIAAWRDRLKDRNTDGHMNIDEMEGHLRDAIEGLMASDNLSEQDAFQRAKQDFGDEDDLRGEYKKANWEAVATKRTLFVPMLISNYFKMAIRQLSRHRGYSLINILGLAIGLTGAMLIGLYIQDERSYDGYHDNVDQIYRITNGSNAHSPQPLAPLLKDDIPEVEAVVRLRPPSGMWMMQYEDLMLFEDLVYWADGSLFDVFSFELEQGDPKTALTAPNTVVISEATARKYFGNETPIGKVIRADDLFDLEVTGVMKEIPINSHFQATFFVSMTTRLGPNFQFNQAGFWLQTRNYTYIRLTPNASSAAVEQKLSSLVDTHYNQTFNRTDHPFDLHVQPLADIHLHSALENELGANSDISYLYILASIGIFLILIATINYMNLATARSINRGQEVGLRKVVGAHRTQLMQQFLSESMLVTVLALMVMVVLINLALPSFNAITGKELSLNFSYDAPIWYGLVGISLAVGFMAGLYPALYLSSFIPIAVLKGAFKTSRINARLRQALVLVQFAISITLFIGTDVIQNQLDFISNKQLGFDKEQVIVMPPAISAILNQYQALSNELSQRPDIVSMTRASTMPGRFGGRGNTFTGQYHPDKMPDNVVETEFLAADFGLLETMGFQLLAGRNFSADLDTVRGANSFLLNETAVQRFGWNTPEEALGQAIRFSTGTSTLTVIGVVKDFHMQSLHQPIEPLMIGYNTRGGYIAIRLQGDRIREGIESIETVWQDLMPEVPFSFSFLSEDVDRLYHVEQKLSQAFRLFSIMAVFIAALGLAGLAAFTAEQRTREIGLRKTLGASTQNIIRLLTGDFLKLVLLANLIAWPVAYIVMDGWLQEFAYRADMGWTVFMVSGLLALCIAFLTVSYQSLKAALANPVESLRHE